MEFALCLGLALELGITLVSKLFCAEMIGFFHLNHGPETDISCLLMFHQILFFVCLLFVVVQSLSHVQLFVTP